MILTHSGYLYIPQILFTLYFRPYRRIKVEFAILDERGENMFDENLIQNLPEDPGLAGKKICDFLIEVVQDTFRKQNVEEQYEDILKGLALLRAFSESSELYLSYPKLGTEIGTNIQRIFEFAQETRSMLDQKFVDSSSDHFKRFLQVKFGRGFL